MQDGSKCHLIVTLINFVCSKGFARREYATIRNTNDLFFRDVERKADALFH